MVSQRQRRWCRTARTINANFPRFNHVEPATTTTTMTSLSMSTSNAIAIALAHAMRSKCLHIASVVQKHELVREQARELAIRHGNVILVNIVFPDSVLWAAQISADREAQLIRSTQCMLARATLAVGGQIRRDFVDFVTLCVQEKNSHVEAHSLESACALTYMSKEVRHALAEISHTSLVLTTTFALKDELNAQVENLMSPHIFVTGTSLHTTSPRVHTYACAGCVAVADDILLCGGCEKTYYCSRECQRLHRAAHVAWCRAHPPS